MRRNGSRWGAVCLTGLVAAGCGGGGPEVRVTCDPLEWAPAHIACLPALVAPAAIPPARGLPDGLLPPDADGVPSTVLAAIRASLAASATRMALDPLPTWTTTGAGGAAERLARQYLDARDTDPALGRAAGEGAPGIDAFLLTAVLKYGPEADIDVAKNAQSVSTTVGTTDLGISSAATHVSIWFHVQFRCALVRSRDGVILWDAAARLKVKCSILQAVTLERVLADTARSLAGVFPWRDDPEMVAGGP